MVARPLPQIRDLPFRRPLGGARAETFADDLTVNLPFEPTDARQHVLPDTALDVADPLAEVVTDPLEAVQERADKVPRLVERPLQRGDRLNRIQQRGDKRDQVRVPADLTAEPVHDPRLEMPDRANPRLELDNDLPERVRDPLLDVVGARVDPSADDRQLAENRAGDTEKPFDDVHDRDRQPERHEQTRNRGQGKAFSNDDRHGYPVAIAASRS